MNYNLILIIAIIILLIFLFCKNNIEKFTNCTDIKGTCSSALCPSNCTIGKNAGEEQCFCRPNA